MGDVIHHVKEVSREQERRGGSRIAKVFLQLFDNSSVVQEVDEGRIILSVSTDPNVYLSTSSGEGGHEVEEGHLNVARVLSHYAPNLSSRFFF